jgi:hypothetical protein
MCFAILLISLFNLGIEASPSMSRFDIADIGQSAFHFDVDAAKCDFAAFTGHCMF